MSNNIWRLTNGAANKGDDTPFRSLPANAEMDFPADTVSVQWTAGSTSNTIYRLIIADGTGNVNGNGGLDFYEISTNNAHIRRARLITDNGYGKVLHDQSA